ncbi:DNA-binding response regulator, partial [Streptomyces sp. NPDC052101]
MIRVLLVHDACLVRSVLAEWLRGEPGLDVDDTPWRDADARVRSLCPDVCAADLDCTDGQGAPPLGDLCPPGTGGSSPALVVLAQANRPGLLKQAAEAGALGFVDKAGSPDRLVRAIRSVAKRERFVDASQGVERHRAAAPGAVR